MRLALVEDEAAGRVEAAGAADAAGAARRFRRGLRERRRNVVDATGAPTILNGGASTRPPWAARAAWSSRIKAPERSC